ncbi:hypothetical protein THAOC_00235, partial [Thalassiosira oceanica]
GRRHDDADAHDRGGPAPPGRARAGRGGHLRAVSGVRQLRRPHRHQPGRHVRRHVPVRRRHGQVLLGEQHARHVPPARGTAVEPRPRALGVASLILYGLTADGSVVRNRFFWLYDMSCGDENAPVEVGDQIAWATVVSFCPECRRPDDPSSDQLRIGLD